MATTLQHLRRLIDHARLSEKETRVARLEVGKYLAIIRQELGVSMLEVAQATGVNVTAVAGVEHGTRWSEIVVRRLADLYAFRFQQRP